MNTIKTYITILLLLLPFVAEAGLPPDVLKDKYLMELSDHLKHERFNEALPYFDKLRALQKRHKLKLPASLVYFEGEALYHTGNFIKSEKLLSVYVGKKGKKPKYYNQALALLIPLEKKKEEQIRIQKAELEKKRIAAEDDRNQKLTAEKERQKIIAITEDIKQRQKEALTQLPVGTLANGFVLIPAGVFQMGTKETRMVSFRKPNLTPENAMSLAKPTYTIIQLDEYRQRKPSHQVHIKSFAIGKYEVTFDQYDEFCKEKSLCVSPSDKGIGRGSIPIFNVSWRNAKSYAAWLSRKTHKKFRLPSEAEWEYAARAETSSKWSWGDNKDIARDYAWFASSSRKRVHPVGQKKPNAYGLYDMHGNVWEWTQDCWNENYNNAPNNGDSWESGDCKRRVIRGGSWNLSQVFMNSMNRNRMPSKSKNIILGFRLVQEL